MNKNYAIIMASGKSVRFGRNKLLEELDGKKIIEYVFQTVKNADFDGVIVVSRYDEILSLAKTYSFIAVKNNDVGNDTAITISLGISALPKDATACTMLVSDQPYLSSETLKNMQTAFSMSQNTILALSYNNIRGNPVMFPSILFDELKNLPSGERGRFVMQRHKEMIKLFEAKNEKELKDIDYPEDLKEIK